MATPIGHTSQFIPTNINVLNDILGQRQQDYDLAVANQQTFEDQYAQIPTLSGNIPGKNVLLNNFDDQIINPETGEVNIKPNLDYKVLNREDIINDLKRYTPLMGKQRDISVPS